MKILVTGASGFVGGALVQSLIKDREENYCDVVAAVRSYSEDLSKLVKCVTVTDLSADTDWSRASEGVDAVVHAAAQVRSARKKNKDEEHVDFYKANVLGTLNLARQSAKNGVKRFVFISSIKAMGETNVGMPVIRKFEADDVCNPNTLYGISKYEAEQGLKIIARETGMEIVIIRLPPVYGAGIKGMEMLKKLLRLRVPLPFGALYARRSVVSIDNAVDFIKVCLTHPQAADQTFLLSDGNDLSTTEIIRDIGRIIDKPAILISLPQFLLKFLLQFVVRKEVLQSIFGSLQVDIEKNNKLLGWKPKPRAGDGGGVKKE